MRRGAGRPCPALKRNDSKWKGKRKGSRAARRQEGNAKPHLARGERAGPAATRTPGQTADKFLPPSDNVQHSVQSGEWALLVALLRNCLRSQYGQLPNC